MNIKNIYALNTFKRFNDSKIAIFASGVHACLSNNENFSNLDDLLATLASQTETYVATKSLAALGGKTAIVSKNIKKLELINTLESLAKAVNFQADGDLLKLTSSGFELSKQSNIAPVPPAPINIILKLSEGINKGEIVVNTTKITGAKFYIVEYTTQNPLETDNPSWIAIGSTNTKCLIKGLTSDVKVYVKVTIMGVKAQNYVSDIQSRMVQ